MKKTFRFIHLADSHNGHSGNASKHNEYSSLRIDKTINGINVRQLDIDHAFSQVMDLAIQHKVDAVLHAGDGWDSNGYKDNYVNNAYVEQVTRLHEEGILYHEIVGNHNLPRRIGKGCHLKSLGKYPGVTTVYKGFYERHDLNEFGVVLHSVPSSFNQEMLDEALANVEKIEGKINIGIGHFGVTSIKHYADNAINSLVVDLDRLIACEMDYFALGDYHVPTDFGYNICYAGPIERFSFGDIGIRPQVWLVEIERETKIVKKTPLPLNVRPMIDLEELDARGLPIEVINEKILNRIADSDIADKVVRFRVRYLPHEFKKLIQDEAIHEATKQALHFKLDFAEKSNKMKESRSSSESKFDGVLQGWHSFAESIECDGSFDKEQLIERGYTKLEEAHEDAAI